MFRSATRQELISEKVRPRLFSKAIQAVDNHTIRIVRTISATTMTPKLNTRIRLSYDCTLSPAVSEIRLVAPAIPLAFTCSNFYELRHKITTRALGPLLPVGVNRSEEPIPKIRRFWCKFPIDVCFSANSMPRIVTAAVSNRLNPSIGRIRCLIRRWQTPE
jgi:hypothetical protein